MFGKPTKIKIKSEKKRLIAKAIKSEKFQKKNKKFAVYIMLKLLLNFDAFSLFNYPVAGNIPKKNKKLAVKTTQINESGRKIFQPILINWSKRYLGTIALTRENKIKSPKILNIIQKTPGNKLNG